MEQEQIEWIISIRSIEALHKRKAITNCEQIINRNGKLLNFKKQKSTQLKFTCEILFENTTTFLNELKKYFTLENHISPDLKKVIEAKKAKEPQVIILMLIIAD